MTLEFGTRYNSKFYQEHGLKVASSAALIFVVFVEVLREVLMQQIMDHELRKDCNYEIQAKCNVLLLLGSDGAN